MRWLSQYRVDYYKKIIERDLMNWIFSNKNDNIIVFKNLFWIIFEIIETMIIK